MQDPGTALLGAAVALLVVYLTQRGSGRTAAADRLMDRRADLYLDVARWLDQDLAALRAREPYRSAPLSEQTRTGLLAFGSDGLDRRLQAHGRARRRALRDLESLRRVSAVAVSVRYAQLQVRAELGAPLGPLDRLAFAAFGTPLVTFAVTGLFSLAFRRRYRSEAPVLVPSAQALQDRWPGPDRP